MSTNSIQAAELAAMLDHWRDGGAPPPTEFNFVERVQAHGQDAIGNRALYICPVELGPLVLVDLGYHTAGAASSVMVGVWSNEANCYCFSDGDCYAADHLTRSYLPVAVTLSTLSTTEPPTIASAARLDAEAGQEGARP